MNDLPAKKTNFAMDKTLLGAGMVIGAYGNFMADAAQADAEAANAAWYREQGAFARLSGERQQSIFDRETRVLHGEQLSAFAKAGVDTSESSTFLAKSLNLRNQESNYIRLEADMNERLANLRADNADKTAAALRDPINQALNFASTGLKIASLL